MDRRNRVVVALALALVLVLAGTIAYLALVHPSSSSTSPSLPAFCPTVGGAATGGNWTTYHGGNARTGLWPGGTVTSAAQSWSSPTSLDGQVYAEPLSCGNTIVVATEEDSVYAINATSGGVLWHTHLGTPVPGSALPCGDIDPSGITGTPVIDVATGIIYVVAFLSPSIQHWLFALDLKNGTVASSEEVDPPGVSTTVEQQRGALLLENGVVYIPFGGLYGDCGQYHGYVIGAPTNGSSHLLSYQVPTQREGAIWGAAGFGVAANGSLYVATGNGASNSVYDYGDSVIELSPTLTKESSFAPTNWVQLNENDADLGSVAPTVLPNGDVFQIGKAGVGYLLSGTQLGGIGGQIGEQNVCNGAYGSTARAGMVLYVPCTNGLVEVTAGASNLTVDWTSTSFTSCSPVVTGNIVWSVDTDTAKLYGLYASNGTIAFSFALGSSDHFITPTPIPGGLVIAGGDELYALSLG
jgi:outer membrane protein assembly factor BamB